MDYTADPVNGFNAVVRREPLAVKVAHAPQIARVSYAYPTPVAKIAYSSPAVSYHI